MTSIYDTLGVPGIGLLIVIVAVTGYSAARPFRPHATWFTDLAKARARLAQRLHQNRQQRSGRDPLPMPHNLWPVCEVGPRMWRWPLNLTRWWCALVWAHIGWRRGLFWGLLRVAWYPSAGLGALAAITQALVLMAVFTVPVAVVWFAFDTIAVLRGGTPPAYRLSRRKATAQDTRAARADDPTPRPAAGRDLNERGKAGSMTELSGQQTLFTTAARTLQHLEQADHLEQVRGAVSGASTGMGGCRVVPGLWASAAGVPLQSRTVDLGRPGLGAHLPRLRVDAHNNNDRDPRTTRNHTSDRANDGDHDRSPGAVGPCR